MSLARLYQDEVLCQDERRFRNQAIEQAQCQQLQSGQVMFLGLIVCGVGVVALSMMLLLGQRVHDMASLHRATDAATYSAALIQARALNLHAYLNRAQIAHQLGMAHLIAAATAMQYRAKLGQQAQIRNPPASLIGAFFGMRYAQSYTSAMGSGLGNTHAQQSFRDAFYRHERQIHQVLAQVRQLQIKELVRQREHAIQHMLVSNVGHSGAAERGDSLKQLGLNVSFSLDESKGLVHVQSAQDPIWRDFLTSLVNQSDFLKERNSTKHNAWIINPRCPFKRHQLRRRGRLELGVDGQWTAEDTLSFHALRYNKIIGCYQREYPMGWSVLSTEGSHQSLSHRESTLPDFSRQAFWRWTSTQRGGQWNIFNGRHNPLAQRFGRSEIIKWNTKGLGRYADISSQHTKKPVRISLKVTQTLKSGSTISSMASAQTYFEYPARKQTNQASLFEPYWKATLIPNPSHP